MAEAPDFRLAQAKWRRRLTLAVSNRFADVQREYRRNGYAKVKSHKTAVFLTNGRLLRCHFETPGKPWYGVRGRD
jgi:hypothetical protein